MSASSNTAFARIASNRRARRDYAVLEQLEVGIELWGTEVKSLRGGHLGMTGSFAKVEGRNVLLYGLNIPPYTFGNRFNHDPDRPRRLLLHRREIRHLQAQTEQKGHALIPLSIYFKKGLVKVELGICKGKAHYDKRETLRRRTADREAERAMADRRKSSG